MQSPTLVTNPPLYTPPSLPTVVTLGTNVFDMREITSIEEQGQILIITVNDIRKIRVHTDTDDAKGFQMLWSMFSVDCAAWYRAQEQLINH